MSRRTRGLTRNGDGRSMPVIPVWPPTLFSLHDHIEKLRPPVAGAEIAENKPPSLTRLADYDSSTHHREDRGSLGPLMLRVGLDFHHLLVSLLWGLCLGMILGRFCPRGRPNSMPVMVLSGPSRVMAPLHVSGMFSPLGTALDQRGGFAEGPPGTRRRSPFKEFVASSGSSCPWSFSVTFALSRLC